MKYLRYISYFLLMFSVIGFVGCESDDTDFSNYFNSLDNETTDDDDSDDDDSDEDTSTASVSVVYSGTTATVSISSDIADYVTVTKSGAHINIAQSDDLATEITYTLSGSSSDGEFYMLGSYKVTIVFNGLTLTNANPVTSGAAVHIQNGKRIDIKVAEGTTNTLKDASSGDQKGALYIKGHAEFKQKGTLNVYGNVKHGIKTGEYMTVKNATINILSAVGDGINVSEYFLMESGSITISGVGDDGIQSDIDGDSSTGETTDHEDEDSGNIYVEGGSISVVVSEDGGKAITSEGNVAISDGYVYAYAPGKNSIDAAGNCYITGGLVYAVGGEDKVAIDVDSDQGKKLYLTGGTLIAIGGFEEGANLSQDCYAIDSWSKNTWYALSYGSTTIAFKTPSSGAEGLVVSISSTPTLTSGVTATGTSILGGVVYTGASISGGSSVTLASYSGGSDYGTESEDSGDDSEDDSGDDSSDDSGDDSQEETQPIAVVSVSLSQTTLSLTVGESAQLTATVSPENADNTSVTWSSSDTSIATVDSAGKITAKAEGTAVITVTTEDGNKTASCTVTVVKQSFDNDNESFGSEDKDW